jgi:hypothetical protein
MYTDRSAVVDGRLGRSLYKSDLESLAAEFWGRRGDPDIHLAPPEEGGVLGFVQGLRLQAMLIYVLRTILSGSGLEVDWGHAIDARGDSCSPECDIIVHRPGCIHQWNGHKDPVMDFKFIACDRALAVVSCKSKLDAKSAIDAEHCCKLKRYVPKVFLFAECCVGVTPETIRARALRNGYGGFWTLYTWDGCSQWHTPDEEGWIDFVKTMMNLGSSTQALPASS